MLLRICALLSLILFSNLAPSGERFEIIIGYQAGIRNETGGRSGTASTVSRFLASTPAARSMALSAYASGGSVQFINELDRTAMRVSVPVWARSMVVDQVLPYFADTPAQYPDLVGRALQSALHSAAPNKPEDEIRNALLGSHPYHHPLEGWKSDVGQLTAEDVTRFFSENYGTDRAFLLMTGSVPVELRQRLLALAPRTSRKIPESAIRVSNAERIIRFAPSETTGNVIFASPVPGVFYKGWYSVLLLDRLVRRTVPGKPSTSLLPTLDPYYWRLEIPVPAGQFAEGAEENLLQEINRLQYSRARPEDLEAARRDASDDLNGSSLREWFGSLGIEDRRKEGLQWIQSFSADDLRATARDLLIMNRVVASRSPRPQQNAVQVESLAPSVTVAKSSAMTEPLSLVAVPPFPAHTHALPSWTTPERLPSGIWLAASSEFAVFLSGPETDRLPEGNRHSGPNGTMWRFAEEPLANVVSAFQIYRANRILVLAPSAAVVRMRAAWGGFKSNERDVTVITPRGNVANIDVPALLVLKAALERKLIEAGWWGSVALRIDAALGAVLDIEGPLEARTKSLEWIRGFAAAPMSDADLAWAREVAVHHLNDVLPDVQSILWQRVPDYILQDVQTIAASQVREVAKLYF